MIRSLIHRGSAFALMAALTTNVSAADHDHDHGADHDHAHDAPAPKATGHHAGEEVSLGTKTMGAWSVTANQIGEFTASKDGAATVDLVPATPAPKSVRVWIGAKDGKGVTKAKGEAEKEHPGGWHCHIEVPNPIPPESLFWVTIETEAGEQLKESFPLTPVTTPAPVVPTTK